VVKVAASAVGLACAVAAVHAEPSSGGLGWHAPAACPGADELRARIERRLGAPIDRRSRIVEGGDPDGPAGEVGGHHREIDRALDGVDVSITAAPDGGFVARIDLGAVTVANEVRVLRSARCDELADAVAVVIARVAAEHRAPAIPAAPERAGPVAFAPADDVSELPGDWGGGLRALGVTGVGGQPGVGVAGELAAYVRSGAGFAELAGARWRPSGLALMSGGPIQFDVRLDVVTLRLGWSPPRLPLRAWVTGELGSLHGEGVGLNAPDLGSGTWAGAGAGFGVAWPISPHFRVVGNVEVVALLRRERFALYNGAEVFRPEVASARSSVGFEVGWR